MSFGTFLSIDFETANAKRVSACSLGIAKVVDGTISEHRAYLIKPVGEYSPFNIKVHGITPDMTKDAPTFDKLFPLIRDDFENLPILCYSDFDRSVFNALRIYYELALKRDLTFYDVCEYAHDCISGLPNYKLQTVSHFLHLDDFHHHDAEADALQCAQVFLSLSNNSANSHVTVPTHSLFYEANTHSTEAFFTLASALLGKGSVDLEDAYTLQLLLDSVSQRSKLLRCVADMTAVVLEDGIVTTKESAVLCAMLEYALERRNDSQSPPLSDMTKPNWLHIPTTSASNTLPPIPELEIPSCCHPRAKTVPDNYKERWIFVRANPFSTFNGSKVVITGEGTRISRVDAENKVVAVGATLKNSAPTRNTDFCVVLGESPESCSSGKAVQARKLQAQGSPIRILGEDEFIDMLKASIVANME